MTDANGITISNITANAAVWAPGEPVSISFKFKNGSGAKITDLLMFIVIKKTDFSGNASNDSIVLTRLAGDDYLMERVNLANGKSRTFTAAFNVPDTVSAYFTEYPDIRSAPIYIDYSAYDSNGSGFGTEFELSDLRILNHRFTPQITDMNLIRAKDGLPNDEGENVLTTLKLGVSGGDYDYSRFLTAKLHYARGDSVTTADTYIDLTGNIADLLYGAENDPNLIPGTYDKAYDWDFLLVFGDEFESFYGRFNLGMAFANMHLSGASTGGVCFGGFSTSKYGKPKLESYYPIYAHRGIAKMGEDWEYLAPTSGTTPAEFGGGMLRCRKVENKRIIDGSLLVKPGSSTIKLADLPDDFKPAVSVFGINACQGSRVARVTVHGPEDEFPGCLALSWVKNMTDGSNYTASAIWVQCSIEYWVEAAEEDDSADTANLIDSTGAIVVDATGSEYAVRSAVSEPYQSRYTGKQIDDGIAAAYNAASKTYVDDEISKIELTPGESAYEIAKKNGFTGTEAEWIESLHGKNGYTPVKGKDYFDGYTPVKDQDYFDGAPGKSAYTYAQEGGYTGTEAEFGPDLNNAIQGGADSVAWEDISGKPFGDLITGTAQIDGDTLHWDGDSKNMPISIGNQHSNWNYVSENVPTKAQMQAGYELYWMTYTGTEVKINIAPTYSDNGNIYIGDLDGQYLRIVAVTDETYTRTGVYFYGGSYGHVSRLTINGYTFIASTEYAPIPDAYIPSDIARKNDVKAIDAKVDSFFEEAGEVTREISWDGVIGDKAIATTSAATYKYVHVSDYAPPRTMLTEQGFTITLLGENTVYTAENAANALGMYGDNVYTLALMGYVVLADNVTCTVDGATITFPKKGTYFAANSTGTQAYLTYLTSPAMQSQEDRIVLKEEHLPSGIIPVRGVDYWTEADKQEIIAAVLAALGGGEVTKPTLTVDADGNATISGTTLTVDAEGNATIGSGITVDAGGNATI